MYTHTVRSRYGKIETPPTRAKLLWLAPLGVTDHYAIGILILDFTTCARFVRGVVDHRRSFVWDAASLDGRLLLYLTGRVCVDLVRTRCALSAASSSAISSDKSSWLRLPPLMRAGARSAAQKRVAHESCRDRYTSLHVPLPLRTGCVTHPFFCLSRVRTVPSQTGRSKGGEGGLQAGNYLHTQKWVRYAAWRDVRCAARRGVRHAACCEARRAASRGVR